jgi:hypothetical protein
LTLSVCSSTHPLAHAKKPAPQLVEHTPLRQLFPAAHCVVQLPQALGFDDMSTQAPLHRACPAGQAQAPLVQVCPMPHATPHPPQF